MTGTYKEIALIDAPTLRYQSCSLEKILICAAGPYPLDLDAATIHVDQC